MIAHVIMLNDFPEAVVLDDEAKAEKEKNRLRNERSKQHSGMCYWHIKSVEVTT